MKRRRKTRMAQVDETGEAATLATTRGCVVQVDAHLAGWVSQWNWSATSHGYAVRRQGGKNVYLHRELYEYAVGTIPAGFVVDHKDRDRTNNRLSNLRAADQYLNMQNTGVGAANTSGFKGVHPCGFYPGMWAAQITRFGHQVALGLFHTPEEAAEAYRVAEVTMGQDTGKAEEFAKAHRKRLSARNTSGIKFVSFDRRRGEWRARPTINGAQVHLGFFETKEAAMAALDGAL